VKKLKITQTQIAPKLNTASSAHKYAGELQWASKHGSIQCTTFDDPESVKST